MSLRVRLSGSIRAASGSAAPCAIWLAAACIAGGSAIAGPADAADPSSRAGSEAAFPPVTDIHHTIQPGDTLMALSRRYAGDGRAWPALGVLNQVRDPRRLRPGSVLRIPSRLLPAETAIVEFVQGPVAAAPAPGQAGKPALTVGEPLSEGARVQVGPEAFVTLRLADGSLIRLRADSDVQLQQLRRRGRAGSVQSVLDLRRGGVESSVTPQAQPDRRFDIRTPTATTSVRGTRFTVDLAGSGQATTSVDQGSVLVRAAAESGARHAARSNQPAAAPAVMLAGDQGVAVSAGGQLGTVRPLLPAPDATSLPAIWHDADLLSLSVPALAGAAVYQWQLANDADFAQVVRSQRSSSPEARWPGLPDGRYYLSIRGVDEAGIPGRAATQAITVKTQPAPPLYQFPPPGGTIDRAQGELRCTGVAGAGFYRIQLASDRAFQRLLVDEERLSACRTALVQVPPGSYFWRAASVRQLPDGSLDDGPFAKAQAVVVGESPATPDAASVHTDEDHGVDGVRLYWAADPRQTFQLQIAAQGDFSQPLVDTHLAQPSWSSQELAPGDYQVRIKVIDPSGLQSQFSSARTFRVRPAIESGAGLPVTSSDGQPLTRP